MAESCKVGPDYPEFVERAGRRYRVSVDTGRDGMIEYFQLVDILTEEFFFEMDWVADSLTEDEIWGIVGEDAPEKNPKPEAEPEDPEATERAAQDAERRRFEGILDSRYPFYAGLGAQFREEAIERLRLHRGESLSFQNIVLDELAESYEE